ncbi:MAG: serine protease [Desmonostoc vinosum HA7617-LM4]|nr:serine protease [Desmonostoc vinosum HA7617-LM4]
MRELTIGIPVFLIGTAIIVVQSQIAIGLTATEISAIATEITVRIDGENTGTGIIIERQGNTYKVVTNAHVVSKQGSYTLQTNDGQTYAIDYSQVRQFCPW